MADRSRDLYDSSVTRARAEPVEVPPCPVCDNTAAELAYLLAEGRRVVVCDGCGLGRLDPLPTAEEVLSFYPEEYYGDGGNKFHSLVELPVRLVASRHADFLARDLPPGSRVLDLGCGRGIVLGQLADRGVEVHGVEVCAAATRGVDPRAEVRIAPTLAEAGYPDAQFDKVLIWHVLEHLRDPRQALEEAFRILKPGGAVVIAVPNFSSAQARWAGPEWFHLDPPRHLFHFPVNALRELLDRCAFEIESEHHFSLRQNPFGWVQSAMNRNGRLPRNGAYALAHRQKTGKPPLFSFTTRLRLRAWMALSLPVGVGLSVVCAALRNGATVTVVARKPR